MDQREKPRLRFAERLQELHENDAEDSGHVLALFRSMFLPSVGVVGVAVVVWALTWLKESLSGRAPIIAGLIVLLVIAAVVWRRSVTR